MQIYESEKVTNDVFDIITRKNLRHKFHFLIMFRLFY